MRFANKLRKELKLSLAFGLAFIAAEFLLRLFVKPKVHFAWEEIWGFYALFGFLGCIIISTFSRFVGNRVLMKEPDYYERRYVK
ncbi:MAG: hypothetical protein QXN34_01665 [Archaeoglobaceae archaeon]